MVDDMLTWLETIRDRPAWTPTPAETRARLQAPVPYAGAPLDAVYEAFKRDILPYPTGNIHPRFWGWVMGTGTPTGVLAETLAATMNPHLAGYDQSAALVERQVIAWLAQLMGFPDDASGVLVSGGNIDQAQRLAAVVDAHPDLQRLAPAPLNIVCFRYAPPALADADLDALNQAILVALQTRGVAVPSQTVLDGRFAIRVCIVNHRSRDEDFEALVASVAAIGSELAETLP
jgi:glutamate/tyrosine decarboxylase-like PLP-dependent enzyme